MSATLPRITDPDLTVYQGDALRVLQEMPDSSVDCVITSPPYWGLRDYGTGEWEGGDNECDHKVRLDPKSEGSTLGGGKASVGHQQEGFKDQCPRCGAKRIDQQLGLEPTPDQYVARMVELFREVRRVLAAHGTCWVNLGDSYVSDPGKGGSGPGAKQGAHTDYGRGRMAQVRDSKAVHGDVLRPFAVDGLRPKNLVGIPWRVAFALQADGWYLRSDIIWAKPNPMPESVTDRPTKAHEYVFLLSKQPRYFYDAEAIREPHADKAGGVERFGHIGSNGGYVESERTALAGVRSTAIARGSQREYNPAGRNVRSVWEIATQPYPEAHFATYPEDLVRRCLLAGCPEGGTVLDPFIGSGTTALVARKHGRKCIGIELNPGYISLISTRLQQLSLFGESMPSPVTAKPKEGTTP